ncbi:MAG: rod shape-determining protein MreC [Dysgonomonas sp.]
MRNLIAFLIKNGAWFFFILLEVICFYFIFQYNSYQRSLFLNSSNEIVGRVYSISGNVRSYFGLKKDNEDLMAKNAVLQEQIWDMENYINTLISDTLTTRSFVYDSIKTNDYGFVVARVVNTSINKIDNFITIDKGSNDGLKKEMGVVSPLGIVGFVRDLSPNFAIIQPLLNSKSVFNCKIKGSNSSGSLIWEGGDYRYAMLKDFPRHGKFAVGDTVVTSGFSDFFPKDIIVGVVENSMKQSDDNFLTLKVRLATDFTSLTNVLVIVNRKGEERKELEKTTDNPVKNAE